MRATELLNFQNDLLNVLLTDCGLDGLVTKMHEYFGCPVMLTNQAYRVIAYASMSEELLGKYIHVVLSNTPHYYQISTLENKFNQGFVFPIIHNHENLGFLLVLEEDPQKEKIIPLANQAVKICAIEFSKQKQFLMSERQYKDAFVFDLLYGNFDSNEDIINRGDLWGWQLQFPHCVVVFELDDFEDLSSDHQLVQTLADIIETELTNMNQTPIVFRKKGEVTIIINANSPNPLERKAYIDFIVRKVLAIAGDRFYPRIVRAGSGRTYIHANEIFRSYEEAKVSLTLGRIMNIRTKIPFFRDLGLARILYNHDQQELAEFYKDTLGELVRYDSEQNADLEKTLEVFLLNRCDLKLAADALYLHPNTLRYRLKKTEEILAVNLNDLDTKVDLMTAFKIKHLKKV